MTLKQRLRTQQGSLLYESMIAILVFSIGVLGLVKLEGNLLSIGGRAEDRIQASLLASELVGMASADNGNAGCYVVPVNTQTSCGSSTSRAFTTNWVTEVTNDLPNSSATATLAADNTFTITLLWKINQESAYHNYVVITNVAP